MKLEVNCTVILPPLVFPDVLEQYGEPLQLSGQQKNIEQKKKLGGSFLIRVGINGETKSFRQIKLLQVQ